MNSNECSHSQVEGVPDSRNRGPLQTEIYPVQNSAKSRCPQLFFAQCSCGALTLIKLANASLRELHPLSFTQVRRGHTTGTGLPISPDSQVSPPGAPIAMGRPHSPGMLPYDSGRFWPEHTPGQGRAKGSPKQPEPLSML